MAMEIDRSKYRNPDMPVGYEKKESEIRYKMGIEINGVHYLTPDVLEEHDKIEDDGTLSDLVLSDDEKEIESDGTISVITISDDEKERPCTSSYTKKTKKYTSVDWENTGKKDIDHQKHEKKKTKPPRKRYRSDSSSSSSRHSSPLPSYRPRNKITYSQPPLPKVYSQPPLPKVKRESSKKPKNISGAYFCHVCNIHLNSILSYNIHVNGKRHMKNLKPRTMFVAKPQSIPVSTFDVSQVNISETSKYPKPVDGVTRKKVLTRAKVQSVIEEIVKRPCIGLNAVTEIQGFKGVQYYCSLCNITCFSQSIVSHLTGQNHMKQSAREFHPKYKEIITITPKPERESKILELLNELKSKQGMGQMAVEVEELDSDPARMTYSVNRFKKGGYIGYQPGTSEDLKVQPISSTDNQNKPSTSKGTGNESSDISIRESCNKASLPNKSASDFYCQICQSHMNSKKMWQDHLKGKRHRTNLKKFPGDVPSKTKTVPIPNKRANLIDRLKIECPGDPIVGLDHIQETELPKIKTFTYKCFLCGSCPSARDIIEHLLSLKHRLKYLDHIDFPDKEVVYNMSEISAYPLVTFMSAQAEVQEGRGEPEVHVLKSLLF